MKILMLALLLTASAAFAEPFAQVEGDGVRIVLYIEPCALPAITNLPHRVEWTAKGKTFAGCWGLNALSLIVMFFDDRTAVTIPASMFSLVQEV